MVSIPNGTIKSNREAWDAEVANQVSIPNGTIKRTGARQLTQEDTRFQFQMVRLKGASG